MSISEFPNRSTGRPLRHEGHCGRRVRCWRTACREMFAETATLEFAETVVIAYCHRSTYHDLAFVEKMLARLAA